MRLIDADALSNAMYRKSFETDDGRQRWDSGLWIRYTVFWEARDEAPTIDAVPVVRCKDCVYFWTGDWCVLTGTRARKDGYCAWGEEGEEDE